MTDLADKFIKSIKGAKLWPPMNGYGPLFQGSQWNQKKHFGKYYDSDLSEFSEIILINKNKSVVFVPETIVEKLSVETFGKYFSNYSFISQRRKLFYKNVEQVDNLYFKLTYDYINSKKWDQLLQEVKKVIDLLWDNNAIALFSVYFDKDFCWQQLQKNNFPIDKDRLDAIWDKAITPINPSFEKNQLLHFLSLVISNQSLDSIAEECQYFLADYYSVKGVKFVADKIKRDYGKFLTIGRAKVKFAQEKTKQENIYKEFQLWLDTLNKNEIILVDYFQTIIKLRDDRKNFINKGLTVLWRLTEILFKENDVDYGLMPYYTLGELLQGKDYLKKCLDDLKKRPDGFTFFIPHDGLTEMAYGDIAIMEKKIKDYFSKNIAVENDIIKGQTGARGKVTGRVKVVLEAGRVKDFKKGDILVTGMTRPEFVPLMKKATAVITDEGGITCHAAIISRELGIPCVIGTKIATQILKDGDMVRVDATRGIVKILERK